MDGSSSSARYRPGPLGGPIRLSERRSDRAALPAGGMGSSVMEGSGSMTSTRLSRGRWSSPTTGVEGRTRSTHSASRGTASALGPRSARRRSGSCTPTSPGTDFSSLFETVARDPHTYARPGVFSCAAGRSFYEPLLPAGSVSLGWSATAVVWLSRVPCPLPDHRFSYTSTGDRRAVWAAAAAEDWERFLRLGAAELRPGGEIVVTTLVSGPGYLDRIALIEAGHQGRPRRRDHRGRRARGDGPPDLHPEARRVLPRGRPRRAPAHAGSTRGPRPPPTAHGPNPR